MREIIRYAWGVSSLGDFVVAMSNKGIVAFNSAICTPRWRTLYVHVFPMLSWNAARKDSPT
jgi:hypothetical protein